jgi:hypothetical protein
MILRLSMEKIIFRVEPKTPENALKELYEFNNEIKALPVQEAEQQIAEKRFRRPINLFGGWVARPFWRYGRKAPSLFSK